MEINNYKAINKGFLVGKFNIIIKEWGELEIRDCVLFQKDNKHWITLPSREFQTKTGEKKHYGLVKFHPEVFKKLEKSALTLLEKTIAMGTQTQENRNDIGQVPF